MERLAAVVDEHDADFAAVAGVDRAGCIQQCDAMLEREAAARSYLRLEMRGQLDGEIRGHCNDVARLQNQRAVDRGADVGTGGVFAGIGRQGHVVVAGTHAHDAKAKFRPALRYHNEEVLL